MQKPYDIIVINPDQKLVPWDGKASNDHMELQVFEDHMDIVFWFTVAVGQTVAANTYTYEILQDVEEELKLDNVPNRPPQLALKAWTKDMTPILTWARYVKNNQRQTSLLVGGCIIPAASGTTEIVDIPAEAYVLHRYRYDFSRTTDPLT